MTTAETLSQLIAENKFISAVFVFAYKHPLLLQERMVLTPDENAIMGKAINLRAKTHLPFWEALLLSCFGERRNYKRLLREGVYHQSHKDSLLRISREEILADRLTELIDEQLEGHHLSFSSKVEVDIEGEKHLPLLDFHCPESSENDQLVADVCRELYRQDALVFSSGESYHAFGLELLDYSEFRHFLTRSLLFAPIIDARYVTHQLLEGACALRLSSSKVKPRRPSLKFALECIES